MDDTSFRGTFVLAVVACWIMWFAGRRFGQIDATFVWSIPVAILCSIPVCWIFVDFQWLHLPIPAWLLAWATADDYFDLTTPPQGWHRVHIPHPRSEVIAVGRLLLLGLGPPIAVFVASSLRAKYVAKRARPLTESTDHEIDERA